MEPLRDVDIDINTDIDGYINTTKCVTHVVKTSLFLLTFFYLINQSIAERRIISK